MWSPFLQLILYFVIQRIVKKGKGGLFTIRNFLKRKEKPRSIIEEGRKIVIMITRSRSTGSAPPPPPPPPSNPKSIAEISKKKPRAKKKPQPRKKKHVAQAKKLLGAEGVDYREYVRKDDNLAYQVAKQAFISTLLEYPSQLCHGKFYMGAIVDDLFGQAADDGKEDADAYLVLAFEKKPGHVERKTVIRTAAKTTKRLKIETNEICGFLVGTKLWWSDAERKKRGKFSFHILYLCNSVSGAGIGQQMIHRAVKHATKIKASKMTLLAVSPQLAELYHTAYDFNAIGKSPEGYTWMELAISPPAVK